MIIQIWGPPDKVAQVIEEAEKLLGDKLDIHVLVRGVPGGMDMEAQSLFLTLPDIPLSQQYTSIRLNLEERGILCRGVTIEQAPLIIKAWVTNKLPWLSRQG